ncbi:MAG: TIGR00730 family Rossman fold protein [Alphaproteobacteria bacterium]|nr:MAG: TIGR00730 family Rossman fold protein [Alphaproteobacteria bacterium]
MTPRDTNTPGKPIKAYRDSHFINSPAARPLRIMSEYLAPQERFELHNIKDTVVFFGSARIRSRADAEAALEAARRGGDDTAPAEHQLKMSRYYEATRELAHRLTRWSMNLDGQEGRFVVASGGGPGLMEATNRGAKEAGGKSVGLGISLPFEQTGNDYITPDLNFEFHYFFMRKFWFAYLAKAFVVMPGGYGTLDEVMEILTLIQTRKVTKKVPIVLFGREFWDRVVDFNALVEFGTISRSDLDLFKVSDSLDETFAYITEGLLKYALDEPGGGM